MFMDERTAFLIELPVEDIPEIYDAMKLMVIIFFERELHWVPDPRRESGLRA